MRNKFLFIIFVLIFKIPLRKNNINLKPLIAIFFSLTWHFCGRRKGWFVFIPPNICIWKLFSVYWILTSVILHHLVAKMSMLHRIFGVLYQNYDCTNKLLWYLNETFLFIKEKISHTFFVGILQYYMSKGTLIASILVNSHIRTSKEVSQQCS